MQNSRSQLLQRKLTRIGTVAAAVLAVFAVVTGLRATRTIDAPYPDVHASQDPTVIERGRYLVEGAAHCGECHGAVDPPAVSRLGRPMIGGAEFKLPLGTFRVPNITPDVETGIGAVSDQAIARLIRYGVKPNGQVAPPFMPFADLSDGDLTAIISYLRTQQPVRHEVAEHDINVLGRIVQAYFLQPKGPSEPPRRVVTPEPTAEYGRYIATSIGNCVMCHTKINLRTGGFDGPMFAGGGLHEAVNNPEKKYMAPNLTPDPRWGWLSSWDEKQFVTRFHSGRVHADSPMPWERFQTMTDNDLLAIYRYLQTLPAAPRSGPDPRQREVELAKMNF